MITIITIITPLFGGVVMINLDDVKQRTDILELIGRSVNLRRTATNGSEYSGPCPFCDGTDRFSVWPVEGRFWCRVCDKKGDVLDYVMLKDGVSLPEAARRLGGVEVGKSSTIVEKAPPHKAPVRPLYSPPAQDWQQAAKNAIKHCEKTLHGPAGKPGLDYLHTRGLTDKTIDHFRLGYIPSKIEGRIFTLWPGILIPCEIDGRVWYLKIRSLNPLTKSKYLYVRGSKPSVLYNAADVGNCSPCIICEGEFNCMIGWQELQDVAAFVSPGGAAKNKLDLTLWGEYLKTPTRLLAAYDNDEAGESGAAWLAEQYGAYIAPVPAGDLNEFFINDGDLWGDWLKPALQKAD